jgi:hypothetical protein
MRDKKAKCRKSSGKRTNFTGHRTPSREKIPGMKQKKSIQNWLGLAVLALVVIALVWQSGSKRPLDEPTPAPTPTLTRRTGVRLTVLHTNDTWGYLLPCG